MIEKILALLAETGAADYVLISTQKKTAEAFYVKKELHLMREIDVTDYRIRIYRDFEQDGKKMRGSYNCVIFPESDISDIRKILSDAYTAALYAANPYFILPEGRKHSPAPDASALAHDSLAVILRQACEALYQEDNREEAFINSAEIFVIRENIRVITSAGTDCQYEKTTVKGEYIVQCKTEQDVEIYQEFEYNDAFSSDLAAQVNEALSVVRDRARASDAPKTGRYNIILSGRYLYQLLSYYKGRSDAAMIYPKYSGYKTGDLIPGDDVTGERLFLSLIAADPVDSEGIEMQNCDLFIGGILQTIHGGARFSYYLGCKPTGQYQKIRCGNGTQLLSKLKEKPYLHIVSFSDFQTDVFNGHFGGEIRLAYLYDGETTQIVTGGSINGLVTDAAKNWMFSKERYMDSKYDGPLAVRIANVATAGV